MYDTLQTEYTASWQKLCGDLNRPAKTRPQTERPDLRIAGSISTLHPGRIRHTDVVDLSGQTSVIVQVNLDPKLRMVNEQLREQPSIPESGWSMFQTIHFPVKEPFPPNTRGFLYWDNHVAGPNLARQIRFRVVESGEPKDLAAGHHLVLPGKILPWNIPFTSLADFEGSSNHAMRSLAWQDSLFNPDELFFILAMARHHPASHLVDPVFALGQPFELNSGKVGFDINVITSRGAYGLKLWHLFCRPDGSGQKLPYRGNAMFSICAVFVLIPMFLSLGTVCVSLDPSDLPEHSGTHTLVMRILACSPSHTDNSSDMPQVGDLVWCGTKLFSVDVDKDIRYPGLRALAREPARWKPRAPK